MRKYINIACGTVFIDTENWVNVDFLPAGKCVRRTNLLQKLPFSENSFDMVYSSHFIEHIPLYLVPNFIRQCYRILRPGGIIRLVTPDLENICREYIRNYNLADPIKLNISVMELLDQCVRRNSGGALGKTFSEVRLSGKEETRNYLSNRFGNEVFTENSFSLSETVGLRNSKYFLQRVVGRLQREFTKIWIKALPRAFKEQNVALTPVGECHQWLWDFIQLRAVLENAGFLCVSRRTHATSGISKFPFDALDCDPKDGSARKGSQSMFVEATKGSQNL